MSSVSRIFNIKTTKQKNAVMEKKSTYWIGWYIAVVLFLIIQVILFQWITRYFA